METLTSAYLLVAGGRDFSDYTYLSETLHQLLLEEFQEQEVHIVSGMADGADTLAIRFADEHKLSKILCPANWKRHGLRAGFRRNETLCHIATHLVAFWDGQSHGTAHMIDIARAKCIPVWVYPYNISKSTIKT